MILLITGDFGGGIEKGWELIADETVEGSAVTQISITGLDLATDVAYMILLMIENGVASNQDYALYFNTDLTNTNYGREHFWASHSTLGGYRANNAYIGSSVASVGRLKINGMILHNTDGYPSVSLRWANQPASSVTLNMIEGIRNNNANVTSLQVQSMAGTANALGIGTRILLFKAVT